ncbi:hypothetical protein [Neobacillus niacini]|uniref:hypothetical protein n=1 Tax=Neobacillus niacini TaxID=86668 RepID=UPI003B58A981
MYHNLKYLQLDRDWLNNELRKKGKKVEDTILATYLEGGKLFIDNYKENEDNRGLYNYKPGRDN